MEVHLCTRSKTYISNTAEHLLHVLYLSSFIDRSLGNNQLENLPKDIFMNNTNLRGL